MGLSLDDLINFLLEEIGLSGQAGAQVADILRYIDQFYNEKHDEQPLGAEDADNDVLLGAEEKPLIDRSFKEQVWKWLTAHPEIWVGRNGFGNGMNLYEVEDFNNSLARSEVPGSSLEQFDSDSISVPSHRQTDKTDSGQAPHHLRAITTNVAVSNSIVSSTRIYPKAPLRIFTSKERMWYAASGHAPDLEKIPDMEFICLSIIAAHRDKGIMQPDLVRITGQDKRSVPGRTQSLHDKGYIVKSPIRFGPLKTSLLVLKRFASITAKKQDEPQHDEADEEVNVAQSRNESAPQDLHSRSKVFRVEPQIREMFIILRDVKIITWDDLKRKLGIWRQRELSHRLAVAVRRWEFLGFVQRVRAAGSVPRPKGKPLRCVKLISEPQNTDWSIFYQVTRASMLKTRPSGQRGDEEEDLEDDVDGNYRPDGLSQVEVTAEENTEDLEKASTDVLRWSPDRPLVNLLFDIVHESGSDGISIQGIEDQLVGNWFNRPLEHQLSRLVDLWQISQPPHLRHLAIVRDTSITGKITHYIHYSYSNFKAKVDRGEASWEAVETMKYDHKTKEGAKLAAEAVPELDEYGFPKLDLRLFEGRDNDATLAQCVKAAKVEPFPLTSNDPMTIKHPDGTYGIQLGDHGHKFSGRSVNKRQRESEDDAEILNDNEGQASGQKTETRQIRRKNTGRPRKYPKEGLPKNADDLTPEQLQTIKTSQLQARQYQARKLKQEIARRIEAGQDVEQARNDVLAGHEVRKTLEAGDIELKTRSTVTEPGEFFGKPSNSGLSARSKNNSTTLTSYLPSVAAHTFSILGPVEQQKTDRPRNRRTATKLTSVATNSLRNNATEKVKPGSGAPAAKKGRARNVPKTRPYLPSVAAHTMPSLQIFAAMSPTRIESRKTSRRTIKKTVKAREQDEASANNPKLVSATISPSIQSDANTTATIHTVKTVADQTGFLLELADSSLGVRKRGWDGETAQPSERTSKRRRKKTSEPLSYHPSIAAHTQPYWHQQQNHRIEAETEALPAPRPDSIETTDRGPVSHISAHVGRYSSYDTLTQSIHRPASGVCVGGLARYKVPGTRGRPKNARLAIFKSQHLTQFDWFREESLKTTTDQSAKDLAPLPPRTLHHEPVLQEAQRPEIATATLTSTSTDRVLPALTLSVSSVSTSRVTPASDLKRKRSLLADAAYPLLFNGTERSTVTAQEVAGEQPRKRPRQSRGMLEANVVQALEMRSGNDPQSQLALHFNNHEIQSAIPVEGDLLARHAESGTTAENAKSTTLPADVEKSQEAFQQMTEPNATEDIPATVKGLVLLHDKEPGQSTRAPPSSETALEQETRRTAEQGTTAESETLDLHIVPAEIGDFPSELVEVEKMPHNIRDRYSRSVSQQVETTKINKITPTGGSIAMLRRKIIMEIVEKCDGVFPGDKEIWYPFTTLWQRRTNFGKPDRKTVKMAQKYLVDNNKLRQLKFTFKTKIGAPHTGTIITLPGIDFTDPRVRKCQQRIIECDPRSYIPDEAEVAPELRLSCGTANIGQRKYVNNLSLEEGTVDLHYLPEHVLKANNGRTSANGKFGLDPQEKGNRRVESEGNSRKSGGRSHELVEEAEDELGEPDFVVDGYQHSRVPLYSEDAGKVKFPLHTGLVPANVSQKSRVQRLARLSRIPGPSSAAPVLVGTIAKTMQAPGRLMKLTTQPTGGSILPLGTRVSREASTIGRSSLRLRPRVNYKVMNQGDESPEDLGMRMEQLSKNIAGPEVDTTQKPQLRFMEVLGPRSMRAKSRRPNQQISDLMNGHQTFYSPTGTFSTEFLGFGYKASQILIPRKIQKAVMMPRSLDDIMSLTRGNKTSPQPDIPGHEMEQEIQSVLTWELENPPTRKQGRQDLNFINHHFHGPQEAPEILAPTINLEKGLLTFENGTTVSQTSENADLVDSQVRQSSFKPTPAMRKELNLKTRRLTSLAEKSPPKPLPVVDETNGRTFKQIRHRGPHNSKFIGPDGDREILAAVIIVRTLTGGVEQNIDWVLLAKIFEPQYSERLIHRRWAWILQKYRLIVEKLQADFQDMFLQGYEDGTVPPLDYEHLEDYDWKWLIEWTLEHNDAPRSSIPDLPATRARLDNLFDLRPTNDRDMQDFFELNGVAAVPKRQSVLYRDPYVMPITQPEPSLPISHLDVARSWVRANIITPEATYSPAFARAKLSTFNDTTIENTVRSLLQAKVIMQENKGRLVPGRNYDMSAHFLWRLRKNLEIAQYQRAAAYKTELDASFKENGKAVFSYHAGDGDVLAVINLFAAGRIKMRGVDVPNAPFGLMDGAYKTRDMDKSRLHFTLELVPTDTYVEDNPLLPLPPPPRPVPTTLPTPARPVPSNATDTTAGTDPNAGETLERYPTWIDINGDVLPVLWNLALAAVLTVVMLRPGVSATDVEKSVAPSLEVWEVQEIMDWIVRAGAGRWTSGESDGERGGERAGRRRGVVVEEWWWLCVGEEEGKGVEGL